MFISLLILLPLAGALLVRAIGKTRKPLRDEAVRLTLLLVFAASAYLFYTALGGGEEALSLPKACGLGLTFRADGFRAMYALLAAFMWLMTALMSGRYFSHYHNRTRYYFFNLLTLSGVMGVFLSDDLYTTFIFFEIMSMASYPWVAHDESDSAMRAAATYLGIAVLGGMVTLMGMFMMQARIGSLSFAAIRASRGASGLDVPAALILFGFLAKAGAFPLHIWLPKAHPVAPAPASALLSGMLTKTGLFGVLVISMNLYQGSRAFGLTLLIIALTTMLLGAVLALFSNNLKRTLACSSMSQIGYILTGVASSVMLGGEGALAAAGAVSHMVNHSLLKLVLFMAAGAVYMNLHKLSLNDIRGFGRNKPLLHVAFLLGALGLAGVPLFNGYASKTMIHEGLVEWIEVSGGALSCRAAEWVFLFAAGLTTGYMLKLYIALFWQKHPDADTQARYDGMRKTYLDARSRAALALSAICIPVLGALPNGTLVRAANLSRAFTRQEGLPGVAFFSAANLLGGAITLVIGALAYAFVVRKWMFSKSFGYIERWPAWLDLESLVYRPVFCRALPTLLGFICAIMDGLADGFARAFTRAFGALCALLDGLADGFARAFTGALTLLSRVLDEGTDHIVVLSREALFVDHAADMRPAPQNAFARRTKNAMAAFSRALCRLRPRISLNSREVTDLRYGSYYTNAVSFGLILCTFGIVFALMYVLLPTLF